jgi:glycosyltransferase involved in cell wall biosynthesis
MYSIVVPTMGDADLLALLLSSIDWTASRPYEICVGVDPDGTLSPAPILRRHAVRIQVADQPGMSAAVNAAVALATGEWLVWLCDDMVCLPGWDAFTAPRADLALSFSLVQPTVGSFPPAVDAGWSPDEYQPDIAEAEAKRRQAQGTAPRPGNFFGSALLHRSRWVAWPTWPGRYSCNDIAWIWETFLAHPDLLFGHLPGHCVYHFVRGTVRRRPWLQPSGEQTWHAFQARYGLTIQDAYDRVYQSSMARWPDV